VVLLKELKERVQDPSNLSNVICTGSITGKSIHLIEEVHPSCVFSSVEDETQLRRSFSHELRDYRFQSDEEQRKVQFSGQNAGRQGLAGAWRTNEQKGTDRLEPVLHQSVLLTLLREHALQRCADLLVNNEVTQSLIGIRDGEKPGEIASWLGYRNRSKLAATLFRRHLGRIDEFAKLLGKLGVALHCCASCHLHCD